MKFLAIVGAFVALNAPTAFAADICATHMTCGTYTVDKTQDGQTVTYKIVIAGAGEDKATVEFSSAAGSDSSDVLHFDIAFDANGAYTGIVNGRQGASGFCGKGMCTFALTPMENASGPYGITGVLRFLPNALEYNRFVAATTGQYPEQTVYQKQ